jgi:hypothetical protein
VFLADRGVCSLNCDYRYTSGATIHSHVDYCYTHVLGVIVNVAQQGLKQDWNLDAVGHNGKVTSMAMAPGHVFLYESATVPHSREAPLDGDSYVNIFAHFYPSNWKTHADHFVSELRKKAKSR